MVGCRTVIFQEELIKFIPFPKNHSYQKFRGEEALNLTLDRHSPSWAMRLPHFDHHTLRNNPRVDPRQQHEFQTLGSGSAHGPINILFVNVLLTRIAFCENTFAV